MIGRPDMLALTAERLFTPIDDLPRPLVLIEHGRIVDVAAGLSALFRCRRGMWTCPEPFSRPGSSTSTFTAQPDTT